MAGRRFWKGFAAGAAAGAGGGALVALLANRLGRGQHKHVIRLEKSLQIGRSVDEVFRAWSDLENLSALSECILSVRRSGDRSHWAVQIDGRRVEWDARIEQLIAGQAIGWKSLSGPKHTGRITFSPLGNDTLVQVTMNYAPPAGRLTSNMLPIEHVLERAIDQVLRDFKASLEGKGQEGRKPAVRSDMERVGGPGTEIGRESGRATGTFGTGTSIGANQDAESRFGRPSPVDYTRPPEAKS